MYSPRVEYAIVTMLEAHGLNKRKAGRGFEVSHALSVAMIVTDYGFNEDVVIAGLLHDTLEDTDIEPAVIGERFGRLVLDTVRDVTEPPRPRIWKERKLVYIDQIRSSPRVEARAVAAADKIHNLSKMTKGLEVEGASFFQPFTAPLPDMIWYHNAVLVALRENWRHPILQEQENRFSAFRSAAQRIETARDET